jgi:hypothetical protein
MLDYWECTAGSGTYGDVAFDSTTYNRIDVPDDYRYSDELLATLAENSVFKAHFKPAKIILVDGVGISSYDPGVPLSQSVVLDANVGTIEAVRAGNRAELRFGFKTPGYCQPVSVVVALYKGESTETADRFFAGNHVGVNLSASKGMYFTVHIPSIPAMDGFTASVSLNDGEAVTRYYSLEGLILDDALESARARANAGLGAVLEYCKTTPNYVSVKRLIGIVYDDAVETVKTAAAADGITSAVNNAISLMASLANGSAHSEIITVAASVDKLTVSGDYIVEPVLLRLPEGVAAADALLALLEVKYPNVESPYRYSGSGSGFYLQSVWDPSYVNAEPRYSGYLSEFDESAGAGWMYSVNNIFPNHSAGSHILNDGDVMRWQYTGGSFGNVGGDLGGDSTVRANKDALTRKIAEINNAGMQTTYGDKYTAAMTTLKKLAATQAEVDAALSALYPADDSGRLIANGYGGTVVLSDDKGNYTVTATAAGYVINAIWVDGVKLEDVHGKTSYTIKTAPSRSVFASFIYSAGQ